jgi:aldehyde dehydrogenase (NAD+)
MSETSAMIRSGQFVDGGFSAPASGRYFEVLSPASGKLLAEVARCDADDVDRALNLAEDGFRAWSTLAPGAREAVLLQAAVLLEHDGEARFLDLLIDESGSTINKARFEIRYCADLLRAAAGESRRLYGDTFPNDNPDRISMVFREPLGIVAVVSPYNAPRALLCKMAAFPLAAGNALVIKPSEETPLVALAFASLLVEAGLPARAIAVLPGYGSECGQALVSDPRIDGIALTGSTATGIAIGQQAMTRMVPMQLELGGKSALLVLKDCDPVQAAGIAASGMFNHAGQICMANSRILVDRAIRQPFCAALKDVCEKMPLGDLRDPQTAYGPLINQRALDKVQQHLDSALAGGGSLLTGGRIEQGLVFQPTVVLDPDRQSTLWREETFGPLAVLVEFDGLEQAIELANDSDYGLSAAVLTRNVQWGFRAARGIRAGAVHIGMHAFQSNAMAPVGGTGMSGIGRSGGRYSTEEFTRLKWVSVELGDSS